MHSVGREHGLDVIAVAVNPKTKLVLRLNIETASKIGSVNIF
jgi:hypothetical protein